MGDNKREFHLKDDVKERLKRGFRRVKDLHKKVDDAVKKLKLTDEQKQKALDALKKMRETRDDDAFQKALVEFWDIYKLGSNGYPEECVLLATLAWAGCRLGGGDAATCAAVFEQVLLLCMGQEGAGAGAGDGHGMANNLQALAGYTAMKGCRGFVENLTDKPKEVTVTICNPNDFSMDVDLQKPDGVIDGAPKTRLDPGECKTIVISIPPNRKLHANVDGRYRMDK